MIRKIVWKQFAKAKVLLLKLEVRDLNKSLTLGIKLWCISVCAKDLKDISNCVA